MTLTHSIPQIKNKLNTLKMYIERGWALIPLRPKGKEPFTELLPKRNGRPSWKPFADRPPTLPEVQDWIERYPDLNIGIITGEASGLTVIDIDRPELVNIDGEYPAPRVLTGRGIHIYLTAEGKSDISQLRTSKGQVAGEVKSDGGYVVAAPSIHPDGDPYRWHEYYNLTNFEPLTVDPLSSAFLLDDTRINIIPCITENLNVLKRERGVDSAHTKREHATSTPKPQRAQWFKEYSKRFEVSQKIMKMAGLVVDNLGQAFRCPFHEEDKPSAALWRPKGGYIAYHDFHRKGGAEWYTLADVYCSINTGNELVRLEPAEGVVWWLRALNELGYVESLPPLLCKRLPKAWDGKHYEFKQDEQSFTVKRESVEQVYNGLQLLLRLRSLYDKKQRGTPFSWRFGARWCGVSINTVQKAMRYLMQAGLVYVLEERPGRKANILDVDRRTNKD